MKSKLVPSLVRKGDAGAWFYHINMLGYVVLVIAFLLCKVFGRSNLVPNEVGKGDASAWFWQL